MDPDKRREASQSFSETLRGKVAASRKGLRLEDLTGRTGGERRTARGGRNEPHEDEEGDRG